MAEVSFVLNAEPVSVDTRHQSALDVVRSLGFTGAKRICGVGGCGACTVLVDGAATEICTFAPEWLSGKRLVTVEGLAPDGRLTSVQRAMIASDAIQCGFCTPGMVVAAEVFVSEWRAASPVAPTREDVTLALDGHLCRCGAYSAMITAVVEAASGDHDEVSTVPKGRPDGPDKVTGAARFTVDQAPPGLLEGVLVRSGLPRAEVTGLDTVAALSMPGVRAVVSLLGDDRRVRYTGQPIAAVAATDLLTARAAAEAVVVGYVPRPSAVGMEASRADGAPNLIDGRLFLTSNYEAGLFAATLPRKGNMRGPIGVLSKRRYTARRRIARARHAGDPLLVEGTWTAASQSHAAPEPHSAMAAWDGDSITVYLSTQSVTAGAAKLAKRLGVDKSSVRIVAEHVGGSFGAKQGLPEPAVAAAELARACGAPVRIVFEPGEEIAYGGYRPGAEVRLAVLADAEGSLAAIKSDAYADSGDSAGQTIAGLLRLSYPGPPMDLNDYDVISNAAPAKPFQAPGAPIALFALETAIDELAERMGTDPISLRRGWSPRGARVALYDWVDGHPIWAHRDRDEMDGKTRGVGVAFGTWHYAYDPATRVRVANTAEGLTVASGVQDTGTGSVTTLARAVGEVFGIDTTAIFVHIGDSALPHGPTSSASRTTSSLYPAASAAARNLHRDLVTAAEAELGMTGVSAARGGVEHAGEFVPWAELWPRLAPRVAMSKRPKDGRMSATPMAIEGVRFGWGLSDAAHLAEVVVDAASGRVRVVRAAAALAAGRIHTPSQAVSQVHGAWVRGIGQALLEEKVTDLETGVVLSAGYDRYRIPRMSDTPEIDVEFFESGFDHASEGGVGIAELAITAVPAAIANAVAAATGWRPHQLPMTPDRVLLGVGEQ